ncbi:hypothetical protein COUCH_18390 [Couchioplanes caeruleus]|uniref:hypothetical protein n=1 Tax=Couchioplanes caeruleus TaxID=56438 RepID=UPI0020BF8CC7|nr:hypothetical protein [Couchioplanes caeruleus]UQU68126.1 hypothetical protein COUCH_18390 [Couchioplanes caeruleus]
MTTHEPGQQPPAEKRGRSLDDILRARAGRRRERIRSEIARNRKGDHRVPTWVMAVGVAAMLLAWAWLIYSS